MGLYSTIERANSSLTLSESTELDNLLEQDYDPSIKLGHMMEFVIQIHEEDKKLFDSLIECDFLSATNYMVMNEAEAQKVDDKSNEVKKTKIIDKIKELLTKLKNFIVQTAQKFIAKIKDLFDRDKKIVAKYEKVLKVENLKGFKGIADFAFPANELDKKQSVRLLDACKKYAADINRAESKEDITYAGGDFHNEYIDIIEEINKDTKNGFLEKTDKFIPNQQQLDLAIANVKTAKTVIATIKKNAKDSISIVKNLEALAKSIIKKEKKYDVSEVEAFKASELSKMVSGSAKAISSMFSAYNRTIAKQAGAYRKVAIICGRYAAKKANGEEPEKADAKQEAAMNWYLSESSDQFVMEQLAY